MRRIPYCAMVKHSMFRSKEPLCDAGAARTTASTTYTSHSSHIARTAPNSPDMHDEAAALRPHPSTARLLGPRRPRVHPGLPGVERPRTLRPVTAMHPLPAGVGQIEHIDPAPKRFGRFDHRRGLVTSGSGYESRLHHVDNLEQAAHDYCNRAKGNSPRVVDWRHPPCGRCRSRCNQATLAHLPMGTRRPRSGSSANACSERSCAVCELMPRQAPPRTAPMPTAPRASRP